MITANDSLIESLMANMALLHGEPDGNGLVEVRSISNRQITSGYFYNYEEAAQAALKAEKYADGVYINLNTLHPGCYARSPEFTTKAPQYSTQDRDIIKRRWILFDVDPVRPAGISSSQDELNLAYEIALNLYNAMLSKLNLTVLAFSGNGYHVLVKSPVYATFTDEQVKELLRDMNITFGSPECVIDQSVFNLSRITKLYGTLAKKGYEIEDRTHRRSFVIDASYPILIGATHGAECREVS
jgi:hypothetical protein